MSSDNTDVITILLNMHKDCSIINWTISYFMGKNIHFMEVKFSYMNGRTRGRVEGEKSYKHLNFLIKNILFFFKEILSV